MSFSTQHDTQKNATVQSKEQEQEAVDVQKQEGKSHPDSDVDISRKIINRSPVQPKLTMGTVGDKYEQEADETADKVMSKPMENSFSGGADDESPTVSKKAFLQAVEEETDVAQKAEDETISKKSFLQTVNQEEQVSQMSEEPEVSAKEEEQISKKSFLQSVSEEDSVNAKAEETKEQISKKSFLQTVSEEEQISKMSEEPDVSTMMDEDQVSKTEEEPEVAAKEDEQISKKAFLQSVSEEDTVNPKAEALEGEDQISKKDFLQTVLYDENKDVKNDMLNAKEDESEEPVQQMSDKESAIQSKEEEEESLQTKKKSKKNRKEPSDDFERNLVSTKGSGRPLPKGIREEMEQRFGRSFKNIRIHTDGMSAQLCSEIGAKAFANGNHIYFNSGQFDPDTTTGKKLLAHELTHTIQQGASGKKDEVQRKEEPEPLHIDPEKAKKHIKDEKKKKKVGKGNRNVKTEYKTPESEPKTEELKKEGDDSVKKNKEKGEKKKEEEKDKKGAKGKGKKKEKKKKGKKKKKEKQKAKPPISDELLKKEAETTVNSVEVNAPGVADVVEEKPEKENANQPNLETPDLTTEEPKDAVPKVDEGALAVRQQQATNTILAENRAAKRDLKKGQKIWDHRLVRKAAQINKSNDKQFDKSILATKKRFEVEQKQLDADILQSRIKLNLEFGLQMLAVMGQGIKMRGQVTERFDQHLLNIDDAVVDGLYMASDHHDESLGMLHKAITSRSQKARDKGEKKAASYPNTERGREQKKAVRPIANDAAAEIEGSYGETAEIITEAYEPIGEQFQMVGEQFKEGTEDSKKDAVKGVDKMTSAAMKTLVNQISEANKNLTKQHRTLKSGLQKMEKESIKSLRDAKKNAREQIDFVTTGARASLAAYYERSLSEVERTTAESLQLISDPDALDENNVETYGKEVATIIRDLGKEFVNGMKADNTKSVQQIEKTDRNVDKSKKVLEKSIDTKVKDFNLKKSELITSFETKTSEALLATYTKLVEQHDELYSKIDAQLNQIIQDIMLKFKKILKDVRKEVVKNIDEAMEPHDEVLSELNADMNEAAADAAWAYDHPVLSAVGDFFAFLGMLILGILAAIALIFVLFYAMAAAIALLVYLGVSVLVAQIIVYGAAIGYMLYNAHQSYKQRVSEGQDAGVGTWLKGLSDVVGTTDIYRAFTQENMSAAERGWKIGFNGTNLLAFFRGRRVNRAVNKTMPPKLTNPTKGGFWKLFGGRKPNKVTRPNNSMPHEEFIGNGVRSKEQPFTGGKKTGGNKGSLKNKSGTNKTGNKKFKYDRRGKIKDGPEFGDLKDHAKRHSEFGNGNATEYYNSAVEHTYNYNWRFKVRHNGLNKYNYVTSLGEGEFMFTSGTISGNRIFTHLKVDLKYLSNKGITLPMK